MAIDIQVNGINELLSDLKDLPENMENKVILGMSQIAYNSAQRGASRHSKSGALLQSLFNKKITGGRAVGHDTGRAPQALWVNFGARPHKIVPSKKKALRWAGPGGFIFAKIVNHPGYIGDPYIIKAKDDAVSQLQSIAATALKESI